MKYTNDQVVKLLESVDAEFAQTVMAIAVTVANADNPMELWAKARGDEPAPEGLDQLAPTNDDSKSTGAKNQDGLAYPDSWRVNGPFKEDK